MSNTIKVSGGSVRDRIAAINANGLESQIDVTKCYNPETAFASGRSIAYDDAHEIVANSRDKFGRPVAGR